MLWSGIEDPGESMWPEVDWHTRSSSGSKWRPVREDGRNPEELSGDHATARPIGYHLRRVQ